MKQVFKNPINAIMTTEPVVKSYDNQDCFLFAQIRHIRTEHDKKIEVYQVRTDLANYFPVETAVTTLVERDLLNNDGEPLKNANNVVLKTLSPVTTTETENKLVFVEQKQDWAIQEIPFAKILEFEQFLKTIINPDLDRYSKADLELQTVFLMQRQNDAPWGIPASKWQKATQEDLILKPE